MAARFTDLAVDALADYLETNYPTYLRAVEVELGLDENDLPDPGAYKRADLPFDDYNNPRVDVFDEDWDIDDDGADIMIDVGCAIVWSHSGDADHEAGELLARRCLTAIIECIWADRSLGSTVNACLLGPGSVGSVTEEKLTRHAFKQMVTVRLQEVL